MYCSQVTKQHECELYNSANELELTAMMGTQYCNFDIADH